MEFINQITPEQDATLQTVLHLAQTCEYEAQHTHQVTRLALRLFDELQPLHGYGITERLQLHYASILHDIGWVEGWKEHHKKGLEIILSTQMLPFDGKERLIIGSIARYHRKALPDESHDHYAALNETERTIVKKLGGCLRLADGLDRSHKSLVHDLTCKINPERILMRISTYGAALGEEAAALKKSDLLEMAFERKIVFQWKTE